MRSRTPPIVLLGLGLLAAINAWLLLTVAQELMSDDHAVAEEVGWTPRLAKLDAVQPQVAALASYPEILAHPVFSRSRMPYVPAPPPAPKPIQAPMVAFVDPGFVLGGIMISGETKRAYVLQKANRKGIWVSEGEDFVGWKVQSITADGATLQKDSHVIEVRLYSEK
jgi:hypothetical protein